MRAGKLKTRRYKVQRQGWGWLFLLTVGVLIGAFGMSAGRGIVENLSRPFVRVPAAPTHARSETRAEERTLTLPAHTLYALQLGAFDSMEAAQSLAASFQSRGAAGYILKRETYRVLAAAYPTRTEAQAVMSQLKAQHQVDAVVTEIVRPEVTLRVSGQRGQLTALNDAYDALCRLTEHLGTLSTALDQKTASAAQLRDALLSERETVQALSAQLTEWFSGAMPARIADVKTMLEDMARALDACLSASGNTALGAHVKYAQLQCACGMAAYAAGLVP